jgi:hypothetical protein
MQKKPAVMAGFLFFGLSVKLSDAAFLPWLWIKQQSACRDMKDAYFGRLPVDGV